ncbi:transcriptional regulator ATRX homolog isoform X1 [Drosophila tropicalis]|uniref:transcriptional regulator ATRX homolog isoform X1 n=1 Tax=Drosophila tropicalis TaxID=46794 RepID=UPI0035ABCF89
MDEQIVSIYDMLVERHDKQKKKIIRSNNPRPKSQPEVTGKDAKKQTKTKPSKGKQANENPVSEQQRQLRDRRLANVVKASDLIQKPGNSLIIPAPTKKEVLNQLVEKMSSKVRNMQSKVLKPDALSVKQSASSKTIIIKKPKQKANQDSRSARSNKQKRSKRSSLPSSGKKNMTPKKKDDYNQIKKQPFASSKPPTSRPKLKVRSPVSGSRKLGLLAHKSKMSLKDKSGVHLATPGGVSRWRV